MGDLCELVVTDTTTALTAVAGNPCPKLANGLARKGTKAIYDYSMYRMRDAMANFQASNKTK